MSQPPNMQPYPANFARYGLGPSNVPQQYMAGPPPQGAGRGYMVSGAPRVMQPQQQGQQQIPQPVMVQTQPRPGPGVIQRGNMMQQPQQPQQGGSMGGYGNAGDRLMMVLNGGGAQYPMQDFPPLGVRDGDNREFSMADSDFPALPASGPSGGPGSPQQRKDMMPNYQAHQMMQAQMYGRMQPGYHQQQQQQQQQQPPPSSQQQQQQQQQNQPPSHAASAGGGGGGSGGDASQQYGLLGLLALIRATDRDRNTLALGTDLTTLGLNLNSTEHLYSTFGSPFADGPASKDPYHLPESFTITSLSPPANMMSLLSDETLLYAFYTSPKDVLQLLCAQELFKRGWRFHKDMQRWVMKIAGSDMRVTTTAYDRGPHFIYDPTTWEKVRQDNLLVVHDKLESTPPTIPSIK